MVKSKKKYSVIIEKTGTGYSAMVKDLPVYTSGDKIEKLTSNILEALNFYLEEQNEYVDFENIVLTLDFKLFFQQYKILNAKFLAQRIGINPTLFSQYVRGRKNPSQKQVKKILKGIHELAYELTELSLIS
jgi:predicted RNase H-like HicB family nuclease